MNGTVICKLPKAGMGNQLFPLMRAQVFAHINKLPIVVVDYHQFKPGPWLRGQKNKRKYNGFFTFEKNLIGELLDKWRLKSNRNQKQISEPNIEIINQNDEIENKYIFHEIPHYSKRFSGLDSHRELVINLFEKIVKNSHKDKVDKLPKPIIGVHIRMGDFRKLKAAEVFGTSGAVRTPEDYFIETINAIREVAKCNLPVSIFTDGLQTELPKIVELPNVSFIEGNSDIVDLMLLSKSKIIVTSAGSTFSEWAAFISNAIVIIPPEFECFTIRSKESTYKYYEGKMDKNNKRLIQQIEILNS